MARTTYAVWETTLDCNLGCDHCGSRAGKGRHRELTTAEALDAVRQLAEVGIREVTLIGGEAFLRPDWQDIARAVSAQGMVCSITTGGYGLAAATAQRMKEAGVSHVSVSVDGLEVAHDRQRGRRGSFKAALQSLDHLRAAGLRTGCNTQLNRLSAPDLPGLCERLLEKEVLGWQLHLTVPMGNAGDHFEMVLQPCELLELFPLVAQVARRAAAGGLTVYPGNNLGYYGPFERELRVASSGGVWAGCHAGLDTLGLEADGTVKGCPSLPTEHYAAGNVRDTPLRELLARRELTFNTHAGTPEAAAELWGFCAECEHRQLCRAGCAWMAHSTLERRGNNPYCHHRALSLAERGQRERLVRLRRPGPQPFAIGRFQLVEEALDAPWPAGAPPRFTSAAVKWPEGWPA